MRRPFVVGAIAAVVAALVCFRFVAFEIGFLWFALTGAAVGFALAVLVSLAWVSRRFLVASLVAAFLAGVLLFMPAGCVGSETGSSCVTVLGIELPDLAPGALPPLLAGIVAAAAVYLFAPKDELP